MGTRLTATKFFGKELRRAREAIKVSRRFMLDIHRDLVEAEIPPEWNGIRRGRVPADYDDIVAISLTWMNVLGAALSATASTEHIEKPAGTRSAT